MKKNTEKKKNVALVFGITKDYIFALANVLIGLMKHNKKFWDDIIVYHDGVVDYEQEAIKKITDVKFVDLSESERFADIKQTNSEVMKKYSVATFYRYECLKLLDDYRKVIWNDVDILIQSDISGLLEYGDESGVAFSLALSGFAVGSSFKEMNLNYRMFDRLWNVGIMVLSDKLSKHGEIYDWCIDQTIRNGDTLLWPDLAILNIMLQEFNIDPEDIDPDKYVCLPTAENAEDAAIVHAYGDRKFWNNLEYAQLYPEWMSNAIQWSRLAYEGACKSMPLVSCVMSCYERYDYLEEAINSVLAQTYSNLEIIVVLEKANNQSKIETFLKKFGDERIKIIKNKEKLGFARSLNVGIDASKGKYIARMDDDDITMPRRFALQVDYMEKNPQTGIVGGNMRVFGANEGELWTFKDDKYIKATTLFRTPFMHPTVMMRKEMLDKNNLRYDADYFAEDYELWSRAVYLCEVANIPECLTCYRSHESQATGNRNDAKIHNAHKRVMRNQIEKKLKLNLTENEIETIQMRKDCIGKVTDIDGAFRLRERTIEKVVTANEKYHVYDKDALLYTINWGEPNADGVPAGNIIVDNSKMKKYLKKMLRPIVKPVYGKFVEKMEVMMVRHDEEVTHDLIRRIEELEKE